MVRTTCCEVATLNSYRVLLVDDSALDRDLISRMLRSCQTSRFEVTPFPDAEGVLAAVCDAEFDVAFLDFYLGESDCVQLIGDLRERAPRLPIVVLTGSTDPAVVEQCLSSGAEDYVNKATMTSQLFDHTVRYAVKRRQDELHILKVNAELHARNLALEAEIERRIELERDREDLQSRFEQTRRLETVGQLASGVAHEFNNVLATINGYGELMSTMAVSPDKVKLFAAEILAAGQRGAELTAKLSSFARQGQTRGRQLDLVRMIESRLRFFHEREGERIRFEFAAEHLPRFTEADPAQVSLLLDAVLKNACEAIIAEGTVSVSIEIEDLVESRCKRLSEWISPGRFWCIRIRDTGVGMSRYVLDRIYEPFFTTKDVGEGSGLGMAAVYGAMKSHRGAVEVQSEPGRGSCVSLWFRVMLAPAPNQHPDASRPSQPTRHRVLVIDDDPAVRDVTTAMLRAEGYDVVAAESGQTGLDIFRTDEGDFDLVLLDLLMPGMDGEETHAGLQAMDEDVLVMILSGFIGDISPELRAATVDALQKPVEKSTLVGAVERALALRPQGRTGH